VLCCLADRHHGAWEQSDSLAARAWLVEFQHIGSVEELHAGGSEPVDAALEGRMLSLGGVDECNATIGSRLPMASVNRPSARVSLVPAAHLLIVLKVAGATTAAIRASSSLLAGVLRRAEQRISWWA
jgi:hypothetical protein